MAQQRREIIISKEEAVFWMDGRGNWFNDGGRFQHKKIIEHFNRSIGKDENGFFISQDNGEVFEKVYFPCEETAYFVFDVIIEDEVTLVLNTTRQILLDPETLFICSDILYLIYENDLIKFSEPAMVKLADIIEEEGSHLYIRIAGRRRQIPEHKHLE